MIIEILRHWLFLSDETKRHQPGQFDTIFDLSVGYDLAGIQSVEIRNWLHSMRNAASLIEEYRTEIPDELFAYKNLDFNPEIGNSITLSTFHGTKAEEIESICQFLIAEMDFNVVIKMNPPMLGKEKLEHLLHDKLGFSHIEVNENAYKVNIAYDDAVDVVRRLQKTAGEKGKTLGVKFGNTLEVFNKGSFLKDKIQYLSGQPLHILHLQLVDDWRTTFGADFPISFSAGVDANNFADCVSIGLVPVTTCTDLLRPQGYGRLPQYLQNLETKMKAIGSSNIEDFILRSNNISDLSGSADLEKAVLINTSELLKRSIENPRYHYDNNKKAPRKVGSQLVLWDCLNCSKCIPVCPNDANFYFDTEPVDLEYSVVEVNENGWNKTKGGVFKVEKMNQIANFADACNDCGNCDVFCPEDGGPYIEKPRFFGSLESFRANKGLSGFFLDISQNRSALTGRFEDREFELTWDSVLDTCIFGSDAAAVETKASDHEIIRASLNGTKTAVIDMRYYHTMLLLLKGMLNMDRVNFVNIEAHRS
jgi:putative selenate reductase